MKKKLIAKTQKMFPNVGESEMSFSSCIAIEPPEKEVVLKKGNIYTVFDVSSGSSLNTALISKVVNDVLYDSYYQSENISPIQSLEKAIVNINDKLSGLAVQEQIGETIKNKKDKNLEFNIIVAVIWGNVRYIVQYGKGRSFIMIENEINDTPATSEGNFTVSSGVANPEDVVILCTESFAEKFPPKKLLSSSIGADDLESTQSCMILKFIVDTSFSEEEVIDFGIQKGGKSSKVSGVFAGLKIGKQGKEKKEQTIATLADTMEYKPNKNTLTLASDEQNQVEEIEKINPEPVMEEPVKGSPIETKPEKKLNKIPGLEPKIKLKQENSFKTKVNIKNISVVIFVLLITSLVVTALIRNNRNTNEIKQPTSNGALTLPQEPKNNEPEVAQEEIDKEKMAAEDALTNTQRFSTQPFYDIRLAEENANPENIVLFNNSVVSTDAASGKIFVSELTTPKFVAEEQTFPGIKQAINYDGALGFSDGISYKVYDLVGQTVSDSYDGSFGVTASYLGNLYSIKDDQIIKYVVSAGSLSESSWGTSADFLEAKAMDIAYSIYVVTKNDELMAYTQGTKSNFAVSGLEKPFNNIVAIDADVNFDNIYIADKGNMRVVVLDDAGKFIKQLKAEKEDAWDDIRGISVNKDESGLFLLSGSKVYEINLEAE